MSESAATRCPNCATELAPSLLSCPLCHQLLHAVELESLAAQAQAHVERGAPQEALRDWRHVLDLLPVGSRQAAGVSERIDRLGREVEASSGARLAAPEGPPTGHSGRWRAATAAIGGAGLLVWKFKFILGFVVTKGKLLLLGLTKSSTLFSMLLSAGVYWTIWGWPFAIGLVLMIYVHEMGHVAALSRLGIAASAPMFVPGFGALVRMNQYPVSPREDARVGLAGPIWGLLAAAVALAAGLALGLPLLTAVGRFAAWINLFNLLPVWQLDGARGFRALSAQQRWICIAAMGFMWFATEESLLLLLALGGLFHVFTQPSPRESDRRAFTQMLVLVVVGAALSAVRVELP